MECERTPAGAPRITLAAVESSGGANATSQEVTKQFGITRQRLYELMRKGTLVPVSRTGDSRSVMLFNRSDVSAFLDEQYLRLDEAAARIVEKMADLLRTARAAGIHDRRIACADGKLRYHLPLSYLGQRLARQPRKAQCS
jgi:hypothetical protein